MHRRCRTGIAQPVAQPRQQLLIGATPRDRVLGQLEFPLPPPLFDASPSAGADVVVGKLRERGAIAAVQHIDRAAGGDPGRRHQGAVAHDRQHDIAQFSRHVVVTAISQLGADLGAQQVRPAA